MLAGHAEDDGVITIDDIRWFLYYSIFTEEDKKGDGYYEKIYKLDLPVNGNLSLSKSMVNLHISKSIDFPNDDVIEVDRDQYFIDYFEAGTYYLRLSYNRISNVIGEQGFHGYFEPVYKEKPEDENNNNNINNAKDMSEYIKLYDTFNKFAIMGTFNNQTDIDYYKFTLENEYYEIVFSEVNYGLAILNSNLKEISPSEKNEDMVYYELPKGTYYIKANPLKERGEYTIRFYDIRDILPPVDAVDVTIQNNIGGNDVIELRNLVKGRDYYIEWKEKDSDTINKHLKFNALGKTAIFENLELNKNGGNVTIRMYDVKLGKYSALTIINYKAEPLGITKAVEKSQVVVKNNYQKDDVVTLKNVKKGITYTIYKDASKTTKFTFKPTKDMDSYDIKVGNLSPTGGTIYVTATKANYLESSATKINYIGEQLPSISEGNVIVKNNIGTDYIELNNLTKGYTYTIYKDESLKKKLTSVTASETTYTLAFSQIGPKKGTLYVVVSKSGYISSSPTKVSFKAQPTPALPSKYVKVKNNKGKDDEIILKGLKKYTKYTIYADKDLKDKIKSFKAKKTSNIIKVSQLGKKAGYIYIVAKAPGYEKSAVTKVKYSKEK